MGNLPVIYKDTEIIGITIKNVPHVKIETSWGNNFIMSPEVHKNVLEMLEGISENDLEALKTVEYRKK